jgi:thioredoxin reductase (NADPH)
MEQLRDLIIIGGGPAGLSAAIYAARANLSTLVIDKNPRLGALGMAQVVANFPGLNRPMKGEEILALLEEQARGFGATIVRRKVTGVDLTGPEKAVFTQEGDFRARTVIIATGSMGHEPHFKGEQELTGRGVSFCATCDAPLFRGMDVLVVGETEEALDELPSIARFARKVGIITHRQAIADEITKLREKMPDLDLLYRHNLVEIAGSGQVERAVVKRPGGETATIEVSGVFIYLHGTMPVIDFLGGALPVTPGGCIPVSRDDMSTPVAGVFAAGDVSCHMVRQAVVSAAEGCIAALSAERFLRSREKIQPQWH